LAPIKPKIKINTATDVRFALATDHELDILPPFRGIIPEI
jgi:hypothetical protein